MGEGPGAARNTVKPPAVVCRRATDAGVSHPGHEGFQQPRGQDAGSGGVGGEGTHNQTGHPAGLSPSRVSRNPWKGAREWSRVPSVWSWFGMPGICLWQCFWGNRLCLCQREKTMFQGNHCSLLGQIHAPSPICPGRVPRPRFVPAAGASTHGGRAAGGALPRHMMVNLRSPTERAGKRLWPLPPIPPQGGFSLHLLQAGPLPGGWWAERGCRGARRLSEQDSAPGAGGGGLGPAPVIVRKMLEGKAKGKNPPKLNTCSGSQPGCAGGRASRSLSLVCC